MPEYLSPGVYVEEVSFRSNTLVGLSTTTTGFVGPTRYGPTDLVPALLTSLADFKGQKIRVTSPEQGELIKRLGIKVAPQRIPQHP